MDYQYYKRVSISAWCQQKDFKVVMMERINQSVSGGWEEIINDLVSAVLGCTDRFRKYEVESTKLDETATDIWCVLIPAFF